MTEFAERMLGPVAIPYIRERLRDGKEFAAHLLDALDLDEGSISTFVPVNASEEDVNDFTDSIAPIDPDEVFHRTSEDGQPYTIVKVQQFAHNWLLDKVTAHISNGNRVCVFEDYFAGTTDGYWLDPQRHRDWVTFVGSDVYHVLSQGDELDRMLWTVRKVDSPWPGALGAFTTAEAGSDALRRHALDPSEWRTLAKKTTSLLVGAYDCESYVLWTRG